MRFGEAYRTLENRRPVVSLEIFPPRTEKATASFEKILPELVALRPDFITVTYGAMGSTRDRTIEIARAVKAEHGIETACHLTCVGSTREDIDAILDRIEASAVRNIVALRGDPPRGQSEFVPVEGGYGHAVDLVRHIRGRGGFGLAVAGYPEKHIEAADFETDLRFLKEKVDAGADVVITQLFYDNRRFFDFVDRARAIDITCPIVPGVLPILSARQVKRITSMCGATIPSRLLAELESAGDDEPAAVEIGIRHAVEQVTELLERGAPGVHFYVLNRSDHVGRIFEEVALLGGRHGAGGSE